ncbi:MAG: glutamine-hydrolyzing carbamoyl-phosphate synthase small subunit [Actinomycetes bacterium]
MRPPALLVCEDGRTFTGEAFGAEGEAFGEAVFCTAMSGYQETLTDPSYHRQVVAMTAPHIGNTGINDEDPESGRVWVAGFVVRDPARVASSWRATRTLDAELSRHGVVGVGQVDTRALTRHLRERGAMRVGVSTTERDREALLARVRESPSMAGADLVSEVTTAEPYVVSPPAGVPTRMRVAALDLGIKRMTPTRLAERGVEVHVMPASSTAADLLARDPDGVFLSNGPGDPATADAAVAAARGVLDSRVPLFGICFGNQVLGRAVGFGTYKLRFGHRGINQPVIDRRTGKVEVTSHNHGFAVEAPADRVSDTPYGRVEVSHVCLNDDVVEGLRCLDVPAFSVQYHPEAAAGPHDAGYLFDRFTALMQTGRAA